VQRQCVTPTTCAPAVANCWAVPRPKPLAPSTANRRCGHCWLPGHQLSEGSGVDCEPALCNLVARIVDRDCDVGRFVRIDADPDHELPAVRASRWDVRGGHPDLRSICLHTSFEPHRMGAAGRWHVINKPALTAATSPASQSHQARWDAKRPKILGRSTSIRQVRSVALPPTAMCSPTGPTVTSQSGGNTTGARTRGPPSGRSGANSMRKLWRPPRRQIWPRPPAECA
jgi:hypothetical protein